MIKTKGGVHINTLGKKIRALRKDLKMTQVELAGIYFTKSYISHIERDKIKPSISALEYLSFMLKTPISFFLEDIERGESSSNPSLNDIISECEKLIDQYKFDEAYGLMKPLLNQSLKLSEFQRGLLNYYFGYTLYKTKGFQSCEEYITASLECFKTALKSQYNKQSLNLLHIYIKLGECYYILNDKDKSLYYFQKSKELDIFFKLDKEKYLYILRNLSILYTQRNLYEIAIDYLNTIIEFSKQNKLVNENILSSYITLATCYLYLKKYEESLEILNQLIPLCAFFEDHKRLAILYFKIAEIYVKLYKYDGIPYYISKSMEISKKIEEMDMRKFVQLRNRLLLAKVDLITKKMDTAEREILKIIDEAASLNLNSNEFFTLLGSAHLHLGELYYEKAAYIEAKNSLEKSITLFTKIKVSNHLTEAYHLLGNTLIKLNQPEQAQIQYHEAYKILSASQRK